MTTPAQADPMDRLAKDVQEMKLTTFSKRPGYGTAGRPLQVKANMFKCGFKGAPKSIIHYDVTIKPVAKVANQKALPRPLLREIYNQFVKENGKAGQPFVQVFKSLVFDGQQNAFSVEPGFPGDQVFTVGLLDPGAPVGAVALPTRQFKITINAVNTIDLAQIESFCKGSAQALEVQELSLLAIQCVNILLRDDPTKRFDPIGGRGNRFFGDEGREPLPQGGVVGKGFFQSFRPTISGHAAINLDTAFTAFVQEGPLMEVASMILGVSIGGAGGGDFGGGRGGRGGRGGAPPRGGRGGGRGGFGGGGGGGGLSRLSPPQITQLKKLLKTAKFTAEHRPGQVFRITNISLKSANETKFKDDKGKEISITSFFRTTHNVTLRYPDLPCVQYGKRNLIPFELCTLLKNHTIPPPRLTSDQTAAMIKISATAPPDRAAGILKWRGILGYSELPKVAQWGLTVEKDMMIVPARVLAAPKVGYAGNQSVMANNGAWNPGPKKFFKAGKPLQSWSIVSFDYRMSAEQLREFANVLIACLVKAGVRVDEKDPPIIAKFDPRGAGQVKAGLGNALRDAYLKTKKDPQLVVVIMPMQDRIIYEEVKRSSVFDFKTPVATQCLLSKKLMNERGLQMYCGNVAMKIQCKLGGGTHQVALADLDGVTETTIIFGADITRYNMAGSADNAPPDIACVVASVDGQNSSYRAEIREQRARCEMVVDMEGMVTSLLKLYRASNKNKPADRIIFYRDGVSEGEFQSVVDNEVEAIKRACRGIDPKYKPKITYAICGKRHHIRFFGDAKSIDRTGNLPAGTVVDRGIVHPFSNDFFLQAHAGLVGTARSSHVVVLVDENKFSADSFQKTTNSLCYQFQRCARAVSIPPPAYYAHILCAQARAFVYDEARLEASTQASSTGGGGGTVGGQAFDPMRVQRRLSMGGFSNSQWYM